MSAEFSFISAFLIGLAGSVHCVGMCGGIVGAFSTILPKQHSTWPYMLAYNGGRIFSYSVAGALAGSAGAMASHRLEHGVQVLTLLSGFFLILLACYIGNWWRGLTALETLGRQLWRYIQPLSKAFLPMRSPWQAVPYGLIWGWLPCGLVYSTLTWSVATGDAVSGAAVMLCFGLGTLPALVLLGLSAHNMLNLLRHPFAKQFIATTLLSFAILINISVLIHW